MNKNKRAFFVFLEEEKKSKQTLTKQLDKNLEINQTVDARDLSF